MNNELGVRFSKIAKVRPFNSTEQLLLSEKICSFLFEHNIVTRQNQHEVYENIVQQIITMFPNEKNNQMAYYYKESNNKNSTGGVLYHKYHTIIKRYKCLKTSEENVVSTADAEIDSNADDNNEGNTDSESVLKALEWLDLNRVPTREFYDKLEMSWRLTSHKRKPSKDLMSKWTHYTMAIGHSLIHIDFKYHFKKAKPFTIHVFKNFLDNEWELLKLEIKSPKYKKDMDNYLLEDDEGKYNFFRKYNFFINFINFV